MRRPMKGKWIDLTTDAALGASAASYIFYYKYPSSTVFPAYPPDRNGQWWFIANLPLYICMWLSFLPVTIGRNLYEMWPPAANCRKQIQYHTEGPGVPCPRLWLHLVIISSSSPRVPGQDYWHLIKGDCTYKVGRTWKIFTAFKLVRVPEGIAVFKTDVGKGFLALRSNWSSFKGGNKESIAWAINLMKVKHSQRWFINWIWQWWIYLTH